MDKEAALLARLAGDMRHTKRYALTVDTTVRMVTLYGGGWRLYAAAASVFYATRQASDPAGTLMTGEAAAPAAADLVASTAGTPSPATAAYAQGNLKGGVEVGGSVRGSCALGTDLTQYEEIAVPANGYMNLYVRVAAGTASPILQGPFE